MGAVSGRRGLRITARFDAIEEKWSCNFLIKGNLPMGAATCSIVSALCA